MATRGCPRGAFFVSWLYGGGVLLSGYLQSSFSASPIKFWGMVLAPPGVGQIKTCIFFNGFRVISSYLLIVVIAVHVGSCFRHLYRGNHTVIARMLPLYKTFNAV